MAYPYAPSAGPILKTLDHFRRKKVPDEITAEVLRKLGLAPKNESYVLNILRFLGIIDDDGKPDASKSKVFVQHKDDSFSAAFEPVVKAAYSELFDLHGEQAWSLDRSDLVQFFRTTDHSSDVVGQRQAATFVALAGLAGHGDTPRIRETKNGESRSKAKKSTQKPDKAKEAEARPTHIPPKSVVVDTPGRIGLTVRIEVNLPADGNQETYDRIFKSIRKNLIEGE